MERYVLNIKEGIIHDRYKNCYAERRMKEENKKYFDNYLDAVNFYEGKCKKGQPCGICMKEMDS